MQSIKHQYPELLKMAESKFPNYIDENCDCEIFTRTLYHKDDGMRQNNHTIITRLYILNRKRKTCINVECSKHQYKIINNVYPKGISLTYTVYSQPKFMQ